MCTPRPVPETPRKDGCVVNLRDVMAENARLRSENAMLRNRLAVAEGRPLGRESLDGRPIR